MLPALVSAMAACTWHLFDNSADLQGLVVLQAGLMGKAGEIFVLDMGEPVKIVDLAKDLIRLSGYSERDVHIEFSGLRPGEKLYEELLIGDNVSPTEHPMIMTASEEYLPWDQLKRLLSRLMGALDEDDYPQVRQLLREAVSGYKPEGDIVDWIYQQRRAEPGE